jgi:trehalose 6-phosphate phosphatase
MNNSHRPPSPDSDWAWFFDIDGTLAAIAPSPDEVKIDPGMRALIVDLHERTAGAVALISGRAVRDIDVLFPDLELAVAGQHGAEHRTADGVFTRRAVRSDNLISMRDALHALTRQYPALLLEDKGMSLALHYRRAPELEDFVQTQIHALFARFGEGFSLQAGKCVVEVVPKGINKGEALREFMAEPPFQHRIPLFVGDDVTDENAFTMVNDLGGISVKVGAGKTSANYCLADVPAVREWLENRSDETVHTRTSGDAA